MTRQPASAAPQAESTSRPCVGTPASGPGRRPGSTSGRIWRHRPALSGLRIDRAILGLAAVLLLPSSAISYEINPLKDRHRGGQLAPPWMKKFDSVHEDMTHTAIACASAYSDELATETPLLCPPTVRERSPGDLGNIHNALIVGVWWNDDPDHFAYANALLPGVFRYVEMKEMAKRARASGGRYKDSRSNRMLYRSHYGDMAFLHAMATAELETPLATQQKIIHWMNFAYQVATAQIAPDTELGQLDHPVGGLFSKQPRMTVDTLFKRKRRMAHLPVSELALGSMLHVVQDSFAAGHTKRVHIGSGRCARGRVSQFYSNLRQVSSRHLAEDSRAALVQSISEASTHVQNSIEASAQILLFARARADWVTVVEPYLRETLFCVDETTQVAGPGAFMPTLERAYELARYGECGELGGLAGVRLRLTTQGFPEAGPGGVNQVFASRRHGHRLAALCARSPSGKQPLVRALPAGSRQPDAHRSQWSNVNFPLIQRGRHGDSPPTPIGLESGPNEAARKGALDRWPAPLPAVHGSTIPDLSSQNSMEWAK